jgi:hypothetical protein
MAGTVPVPGRCPPGSRGRAGAVRPASGRGRAGVAGERLRELRAKPEAGRQRPARDAQRDRPRAAEQPVTVRGGVPG